MTLVEEIIKCRKKYQAVSIEIAAIGAEPNKHNKRGIV